MSDDTVQNYEQRLSSYAKDFIHFIAKKDGHIIAAASLFLPKGKIAGLYNLVVLPEYRRQGIASALHHSRLNAAKERGYHYATLQKQHQWR